MKPFGESRELGLREEVDELKRALRKADEDRRKREAEIAGWRRKVVGLAESYRRRLRQVTEWAQRLSAERASLRRERDRLLRRIVVLEDQREAAQEETAAVRGESIERFLRRALESPPERARLARIAGSDEHRRRILSLLPDLPA